MQTVFDFKYKRNTLKDTTLKSNSEIMAEMKMAKVLQYLSYHLVELIAANEGSTSNSFQGFSYFSHHHFACFTVFLFWLKTFTIFLMKWEEGWLLQSGE